jgi:hypothetical protein
MAKPRDDRQKDLLRPPLEVITDHGHPLVRLAREVDWGFSRPLLRRRVCTWRRPARPTDAAGRRSVHLEAHARCVGRGAARALGGEPVLPVLVRRIEFLPPAVVRPFVAEALASAAGRGAVRGAAPRELVGGAQDRGAGDAAHHDLDCRPAGADMADDMARHQCHLGPVRRLAGAHDDGDGHACGRLVNVDRQETTAVVVALNSASCWPP